MKTIRKWLAPILTALMWLIAIMMVAVTFSFVLQDTQYFYTITIWGVIIMLFTNIIWAPTGVEKAEQTAKVHNNTVIFTNRANYIVNNQLFSELRQFCEERNEEYEKELITHKLAKRQLKYDEFIKYCDLKKLSMQHKKNVQKKEELTLEEYIEQFTKKQIKLLDKLSENGVRFKKLRPDHMTKGHQTNGKLVPFNKEHIYRSFILIGKVVWGLVIGAFMAYIVIKGKSKFGIAELFQILIWTCSIITNIFTSIRNAYKSVFVYRNNYLVDKNDRCAEFFKFIEKQVKDIDQMVDGLLKKDNK